MGRGAEAEPQVLKSMPRKRPEGMTLVELLVVISIIGLLVAMNYTGAWVMDTPSIIKDAVIPAFMCPSDRKSPNYGGGGPYRSGGWGFQGNYVANATSSYLQITRTERGYELVKLDGVFYGNSAVQPAHIRDGMSQTLLLSEVKTRGTKGDSGWGDGGGYWGGGQHAAFGFTAMDVPNTAVSDRTFQCKVGDANDPPCVSVGDSYQKAIYARSFHVGGVNVVLADSAVRFLTNAITPATWKGMATRAGGETPGDE